MKRESSWGRTKKKPMGRGVTDSGGAEIRRPARDAQGKILHATKRQDW